jgi:hypothetical protein
VRSSSADVNLAIVLDAVELGDGQPALQHRDRVG